MEFTAEMIAGFLGGDVEGDPKAAVSTFAKIEEGHPGALSFLSNLKYERYIYGTESSIVIVAKSFKPSASVKATLVKVDDPYASFAKLLQLYEANKPQKRGVSPLASVDASVELPEDAYVGEFAVICAGVKLGRNAKIHPQTYLGENVTVGDNVVIWPGAKVFDSCVLGNNVTLNAGAVIGADGFGFAPNADGTYSKIPQLGNVILEDNVDIGVNTCIDRATMGSTIIREGTKLDNLIQIGHNCTIGRNTVAAAQLGVAGSSKIGDNCMFGGQVGIAGHLTIGNNVKLGSKTGVSKSIPDGETQMGYPAMPASGFHRSSVIFRDLPELNNRLRQLEKQIKELTAKGE